MLGISIHSTSSPRNGLLHGIFVNDFYSRCSGCILALGSAYDLDVCEGQWPLGFGIIANVKTELGGQNLF